MFAKFWKRSLNQLIFFFVYFETFFSQILAENDGKSDENGNIKIVDPQSSSSSSSSQQMIDKDDPRSRLHFVKYLKRDGKSLKIWECGICEYRDNLTLSKTFPFAPRATHNVTSPCNSLSRSTFSWTRLDALKYVSEIKKHKIKLLTAIFNRTTFFIYFFAKH